MQTVAHMCHQYSEKWRLHKENLCKYSQVTTVLKWWHWLSVGFQFGTMVSDELPSPVRPCLLIRVICYCPKPIFGWVRGFFATPHLKMFGFLKNLIGFHPSQLLPTVIIFKPSLFVCFCYGFYYVFMILSAVAFRLFYCKLLLRLFLLYIAVFIMFVCFSYSYKPPWTIWGKGHHIVHTIRVNTSYTSKGSVQN